MRTKKDLDSCSGSVVDRETEVHFTLGIRWWTLLKVAPPLERPRMASLSTSEERSRVGTSLDCDGLLIQQISFR